eukprot:TRINITY_DN6490_c0_g4_i1.p1 TRINITY_DN6490_c0_g4~~TRINITY_DN6490_c0_g4_i1.p1  ORF type:complete len:538 (+),score=175.27 TRINITY_DN6490_c0_g4_i1:102-1616(+)
MAQLAKRSYCYFDIVIDKQPVGRMTMMLYDDIVPRTAENFRKLCTGECDMGKTTNAPLHYKNTIFHRVVAGFIVQGGDFSKYNGTGGESVFGGRFADENFIMKHSKRGILSMANTSEPDSNGSQFFITCCDDCSHLDGKHVVFGEVIDGFPVLGTIENLKTAVNNDRPITPATIADSGVISYSKVKHLLHRKTRSVSAGSVSDESFSESSSGTPRRRVVHRRRASYSDDDYSMSSEGRRHAGRRGQAAGKAGERSRARRTRMAYHEEDDRDVRMAASHRRRERERAGSYDQEDRRPKRGARSRDDPLAKIARGMRSGARDPRDRDPRGDRLRPVRRPRGDSDDMTDDERRAGDRSRRRRREFSDGSFERDRARRRERGHNHEEQREMMKMQREVSRYRPARVWSPPRGEHPRDRRVTTAYEHTRHSNSETAFDRRSRPSAADDANVKGRGTVAFGGGMASSMMADAVERRPQSGSARTGHCDRTKRTYDEPFSKKIFKRPVART